MKAYAGIGSRETPDVVLQWMRTVATALATKGWTLRTGGAPGADQAFEYGSIMGSIGRTHLFLPWAGFEGKSGATVKRTCPSVAAFEIAERFHPAWARLSQGAQKLHARNVHQILGDPVDVTHASRFVICWTPNASGSGGTGQAIRIARAYDIPIFDVADPAAMRRVGEGLGVAPVEVAVGKAAAGQPF